MSKDAWLATVAAVMTSIRDDRRDLAAFGLLPEWREFVGKEMELKVEALAALNAAVQA